MSNDRGIEVKLETLLRCAGRNIDQQTVVPAFWPFWVKARVMALFGSDDIQTLFMPVGATAVIMAAFIIGQLLPVVTPSTQDDVNYVNTIDMTAFEDVWETPTDSLLTMDTLNPVNERRKNGNQMDARGNGHTK